MKAWWALLGMLLLPLSGPAAEPQAWPNTVRVVVLRGKASLFLPGRAATPIFSGERIPRGSRVVTVEGGGLVLLAPDGVRIALGSNSDLYISALVPSAPRSSLRLDQGYLRALIHRLAPGSGFEVFTSNAVAGVKGTDFYVGQTHGATQWKVYSTQKAGLEISDWRGEPLGTIGEGEQGVSGPGGVAKSELGSEDYRDANARFSGLMERITERPPKPGRALPPVPSPALSLAQVLARHPGLVSPALAVKLQAKAVPPLALDRALEEAEQNGRDRAKALRLVELAEGAGAHAAAKAQDRGVAWGTRDLLPQEIFTQVEQAQERVAQRDKGKVFLGQENELREWAAIQAKHERLAPGLRSLVPADKVEAEDYLSLDKATRHGLGALVDQAARPGASAKELGRLGEGLRHDLARQGIPLDAPPLDSPGAPPAERAPEPGSKATAAPTPAPGPAPAATLVAPPAPEADPAARINEAKQVIADLKGEVQADRQQEAVSRNNDLYGGKAWIDRNGYWVEVSQLVERPDPATVDLVVYSRRRAGPDAGTTLFESSLTYNQALPQDWTVVYSRPLNDPANLLAGQPNYYLRKKSVMAASPAQCYLCVAETFDAPQSVGGVYKQGVLEQYSVMGMDRGQQHFDAGGALLAGSDSIQMTATQTDDGAWTLDYRNNTLGVDMFSAKVWSLDDGGSAQPSSALGLAPASLGDFNLGTGIVEIQLSAPDFGGKSIDALVPPATFSQAF